MPLSTWIPILGILLTVCGGVIGAFVNSYFTARFRRSMDRTQIALQEAQREETTVRTLTDALDDLRKHVGYLREENEGLRILVEQSKRINVKAKVVAEEAVQQRDELLDPES